MNKERLILIRQLFDEALLLPKSERESFLNLKCSNDSELKNEIISLLNSLENTEDFLEEQVTDVSEKRDSVVDPFIGKQIGNYIIDGKAGIGGMGVVYSGKRNDKSFQQKAAIKILRHGLNSDYHLKRFLIERQTLASLQYPFIASLLDGGQTDEGLPYLVMEFIDGIPITEYCNQHDLIIRDRLKLFRDVCSAVQYAHQNLIVHRDLKPGNILVTNEGQVKLLDFGIAKLLDENMFEDTEGLTKTGVWHLTPEYASPEQIKGEAITTASDIYSLGVMLYQILTKEQPYKITNNSPSAISKMITEENIIKPSERVRRTITNLELKETDDKAGEKNSKPSDNSEKLFHHLKGDLDNIVLKAMHKEPSRRYVSVEQFSEDIRRHLVGLPVIAQKDTAGYRVSKFIQRHKKGVVVSSIFLLFMIISLIAFIWQANVAANERDNAKLEAQKVEEVNKFLQEMLASADPTEAGRDVKVYDVLKKASEDVENNFIGHPEIEASVRKTIGKTLVNLGEYSEAKSHLLKSLTLNRKAYGEESFQCAESLHELALFYDWDGDFNLSDSLYTESILLFRKNKNSPPRSIASALNDYATLKQEQDKYQESLILLNEAYKIYLTNFGEKDRDVASVSNNLGLTYEALNKIDEAEKYYKKSLDIYLEKSGPNRPEISTLFNNLAYIYIGKNDFAKAEDYFKKSLELKIQTLGKNHSLVGLAYMNLGALQYTMKNFSLSEKNLLSAFEILNTSQQKNHVWLGLTNFWYSKILLEKNEFDLAEKYNQNALTIYKKNYPEGHSNIISAYAELGIIKFYQKKYSEAEKLLVDGYERIKVIKGENNFNTIRFLEYLVDLYDVNKNSEKLNYYKNLLNKTKE